jgi:UDP-N-acetylmuramate--alanine ligase
MELGIGFDDLSRGLLNLSGVGRRLEKKGEAAGISVLDDYGHHPTEIQATLRALSECFPENRKVVLFQPHRHTRTKDLFQEFVASFSCADLLFLSDIYAAGESGIPGIDASSLAEAIKGNGHGNVSYGGSVKELAQKTLSVLKSGDVVLTLGAGNIWEAGEEILKTLNAGGL